MVTGGSQDPTQDEAPRGRHARRSQARVEESAQLGVSTVDAQAERLRRCGRTQQPVALHVLERTHVHGLWHGVAARVEAKRDAVAPRRVVHLRGAHIEAREEPPRRRSARGRAGGPKTEAGGRKAPPIPGIAAEHAMLAFMPRPILAKP